MTQFQPTDKPSRLVKGQPFDIPDGDVSTQEKIQSEGVAEPVAMVGQTGPPNAARRVVEVAQADMRDDPLSHPQDRALADSLDADELEEITTHNDESQVKAAQAAKADAAADSHGAETGDATVNPTRVSSAATRRNTKQAKGGEGKSE